MSIQDDRRSEVSLEAESLDGEIQAGLSTQQIEPEPPAPAQPLAPPTARGYSWQATMDLVPGMVIARPVVGTSGGRAAIHLAIGSVITANTIAQLVNKGVDCVAVVDADPPQAEIYAARVCRHEARLHEIFEPKPDETCRPLFEALIKNGPC